MTRRRRAWRRWLVLGLAVHAGFTQAAVDVRIEGLDETLRDNVLRSVTLVQDARDKDLDQGLVESMYRDGRAQIEAALQPYGYYSPVIEGELGGDAPDWTVRWRVEPGPRTQLREVTILIDGSGAADFAALREQLLRTLRPGDPLLHLPYEEAKQRIARQAYALGYLDARFRVTQLRVHVDKQVADIELQFETGPRYVVGALDVEQNRLDEDVLLRYVPIKVGEYFDPQRLLDTQFQLSDLGYFETVDVTADRAQARDGSVPVRIHAIGRPLRRYELGGGYGTDTGPRVIAGLTVRRLNGRGHSAMVEARLSQLQDNVTAEYRIPQGSRPGESLSLASQYTRQTYDTGAQDKTGVELSWSRIPGRWKRRIYIGYAHEVSALGDTTQRSDLLTPGIAFNRSELDDPVATTRGWSAFIDVHGAQRGVVSSTSFVSTHTILRGTWTLRPGTQVFGRYEFAGAFVEQFGELPASERFFAGGEESVRGYAYRSLGPKDDEGNVVGGRFLTTYSLELEQRIRGSWGAAVFQDAGGADDTLNPRLFHGIGAGVRYRSPVGALKLDLAHPLEGNGVRVHLGVRVGL